VKTSFTTVRTEGGLLPADLLTKVLQRDPTIGGVTEESYHVTGEKLNEAISRSWNRLLGVWKGFQEAAEKLPANDFGTTITREKWLLPLFEELRYGRLKQRTFEVDGATVPISHGWENVPIHLAGFRISIDKRTPGAAGAAKKSPHSLLQEFLNRTAEHAWGIVSNGETLRLLRDNVALTRQAFIEFDLKAMMEGEVYSDFAVLWMLCHQSRLDAAKPEEFWLERWSKVAQDQGIRALDQLRDGVAKAIEALGAGLLGHRDNQGLRDALAAGELDKQEYYRQLLRIVYRLLFLFVAEDRDLLLDPDGSAEGKDRYRTFYSTQRLRQLASSRRGTRHRDLYEQLRFVFRSLDAEDGCAALALKPLGSFLFSSEATMALDRSALANIDLLAAVRHLSVIRDGRVTRVVDFRNLRSEELGSVYEALLEMHPEVHLETGAFELKTAAGNERKTTGSYYTPEGLVQLLLDSALDPVLAEAAAKPNPEQAILDLNVCDPACGSGHFLIAASHRIAKKLASIRTGDEEADPGAMRKALRDVIAHCIYGVDLNSMAVELCKVALWMEALDPGKPLSFLEQKIQRGNSLLGTTPALLAKGIPDDAFDPIEGDDREACKRARQHNKRYRDTGQETFGFAAPWERLGDLASGMVQLESASDETLHDVRAKEKRWKEIVESTGYLFGQLWADAWCAAFVWNKSAGGMSLTEETFRKIERSPYSVDAAVREEIRRLAKLYKFFHWHLRFPDVFQRQNGPEMSAGSVGWSGGFDVVLGNPPWDRVKILEKEWFATRHPEIMAAPNAAARSRLIDDLRVSNPHLHGQFVAAKRESEGASHLLRDSGRYPLAGRGDVNTFAVFSELNKSLLNSTGRAGFIVPSAIATDDTTKFFFQDVVASGSIASLYDFQSGPGLFGEVGHARFKFSLLTLVGSAWKQDAATFAFFLRDVHELSDPERTFTLSADDIGLLNPNTKTCPIFRTRRDAEITRTIFRRVPILLKVGPPEANPWGISFLRMFDMSNDSGLFRTKQELEADGWTLKANRFVRGVDSFEPLYEAKMVHHFNHRYGDYADKPDGSESTSLPDVPIQRLQDPTYEPLPRYWLPTAEVDAQFLNRWPHPWLLGWRDICRSTDERTVIAALLPRVGVGNNLPLSLFSDSSLPVTCLVANASSFVFDYVARQKLGGTHLNFFIAYQLPVLPPSQYLASTPWGANAEVLTDWIHARVIELACSSDAMSSLGGRDINGLCPYVWNEQRRTALRAELDAAFFHLYGIARADVDYIMDTFHIVREHDLKKFGRFETKERILEFYDEMKSAMERITIDVVPDVVPTVTSELRASLLILALLHENGGRAARADLARAFSLTCEPALLAKYIPSDAADAARRWQARVGSRTIQSGLFAAALSDLAGRDAVQIRVESSTAIVSTTPFTPAADQLDAWFKFEARLALRAIANLRKSSDELDALIADQDPGALREGIA
jgi:N-6 DNA Methylase